MLNQGTIMLAQLIMINEDVRNPTCPYDVGGAYFQATNGKPPYNFSWSDGDSTYAHKYLSAGKYSVTITDSSIPPLSISRNFEITFPPPYILHYHCFCEEAKTDGQSRDWNTPRYKIQFDSLSNVPVKGYNRYRIDSREYVFSDTNRILKNRVFDLTEWKLSSITKVSIFYINDWCQSNPDFDIHLESHFGKLLHIVPNIDTFYIKKGSLTQLSLNPIISKSLDSLDVLEWSKSYDLATNETDRTYQAINCNRCPTLNIQDSLEACYRVKVKDRYNCPAYALFYIKEEKKVIKDTTIIIQPPTKPIPAAYLPTAFSPNDDGINDYFTAFSGGEMTKVLRMQVYDRWGGLLFENQDFEPNVEGYGWNGKQRGTDMPQGNYTYHLRLLLKDGSEKTAKGEVMLMR